MSKLLLVCQGILLSATLVMGPSPAGAADIVMDWAGGICGPPSSSTDTLDIVTSGSSYSCDSLRIEDANGAQAQVVADESSNNDILTLENAKIIATADIVNYPITIRRVFSAGPTVPNPQVEVHYQMEGQGIFSDGDSDGNVIKVDSRITNPVNTSNNLDESDDFEVVCWFGFCFTSDLAFDKSQLHSSKRWTLNSLSGDRSLKFVIFMTLDQGEYVTLNFVKLFSSGSPDVDLIQAGAINEQELKNEMRRMIRDYHKQEEEMGVNQTKRDSKIPSELRLEMRKILRDYYKPEK